MRRAPLGRGDQGLEIHCTRTITRVRAMLTVSPLPRYVPLCVLSKTEERRGAATGMTALLPSTGMRQAGFVSALGREDREVSSPDSH